jgi:sugar/nucleoside kinase (ribokinase family)
MKVLFFGIANADITVKPVNDIVFPKKNEDKFIGSSVTTTFVDQFVLENGGNAMSACVAAARLGVECTLVTSLGDEQDIFSNFLLKVLKDNKIDSSLIKRLKGKTCGLVVVLINQDGERKFLYNLSALKLLKVESELQSRLHEFDIVSANGVFQMESFDGDGTAQLFREVHKLGKITVMDVGPDNSGKWLKTIQVALPYCDFFLPSYIEAQAITGKNEHEQMADFLLNEGVKTVIIKLGPEGCYYKSKDMKGYINAYPIDVIDTTGAGDCFCGGFVKALTNKWDLAQCCRFACAVGSLNCAKVGATKGIESYKQVIQYMKICDRSNGRHSPGNG